MVCMKSRYMGTHAAIYGNVAICRQWCTACDGWALIIDGEFSCCDKPTVETPTRYRRESEPVQRRSRPPRRQAKAQLDEQGDRCFYCDLQFGAFVSRDGKDVRLTVCWDHFVPWAYNQDNRMRNFVAACQICNGIKSSRCFGTVDEAKEYIASRRAAKGYL